MSTRRPPTPRHFQPYSPRRPSPLGFPPLAPHVAFHQSSYSWPHTPDRSVQPKGPSNVRVAFPEEARRPPLAGSTKRPKSQPPPHLNLDSQHRLPSPPKTGNTLTVPGQEALESSVSPTMSDASTLSLYSAESITKNFPVASKPQQEQEGTRTCCFGFLSFFISKSNKKENKILGPPCTVQPAPVPQMSQTGRRRPSPLNL